MFAKKFELFKNFPSLIWLSFEVSMRRFRHWQWHFDSLTLNINKKKKKALSHQILIKPIAIAVACLLTIQTIRVCDCVSSCFKSNAMVLRYMCLHYFHTVSINWLELSIFYRGNLDFPFHLKFKTMFVRYDSCISFIWSLQTTKAHRNLHKTVC